MKLSNELRNVPQSQRNSEEFMGEITCKVIINERTEGLRSLLVLMSPITPYLTSELWSVLEEAPAVGFDAKVHRSNISCLLWTPATSA